MKFPILFLETLCFALVLDVAFGCDTCPLDCKSVSALKELIAECETYTFKITETKGTFNQVRAECFELGGDLLHRNFGPAGAKYHKEIEAVRLHHDLLWIGYTDREKEGTWRFLNGELYDAGDHDQEAFCYWAPQEPDNMDGNQNCAKMWYSMENGPSLDDDNCDYLYRGLCEIKISNCGV